LGYSPAQFFVAFLVVQKANTVLSRWVMKRAMVLM